MQIHDLIAIVGLSLLPMLNGCGGGAPRETPEARIARQTIDEVVNVEIRQKNDDYRYDSWIIRNRINAITNVQERLVMTRRFVRTVVSFEMPDVSAPIQLNVSENYFTLLRMGREIAIQNKLGDRELIDFVIDGLLKSRKLCCSLPLDDQRPDEREAEFIKRMNFIWKMRSDYGYIHGCMTSFLRKDMMRMSPELQAYARERLEEIPKVMPQDEVNHHPPKFTWRDERDRLIGRVPTATNQVESGKGDSHAPKK